MRRAAGAGLEPPHPHGDEERGGAGAAGGDEVARRLATDAALRHRTPSPPVSAESFRRAASLDNAPAAHETVRSAALPCAQSGLSDGASAVARRAFAPSLITPQA
jgi:hypothetical protein